LRVAARVQTDETGKHSWDVDLIKTRNLLDPAHDPHDESDEDNRSENAADIHTNLRLMLPSRY